MRSMLAAIVATMFIAPAAFTEEGPWSRFRGPNGSGISTATGIPVKWTDADYNWKIKLPGIGYASPVVWDKRLFITSGDPTTAHRMVFCIDAPTGRILWQRDYDSRPFKQHQDNCYASATPAADAAGIVVSWSTPEQVVLLALDNDGREVWKRELGPYVGIWGSAVSPVFVDDLVIFNNDQEDPKAIPSVYSRSSLKEAGTSFVIALDRKTGKTRWQLDRKSDICGYGTPAIHRGEDGRPQIILANKAHGVFAIDAAAGKVVWDLPALFKDRSVSSPILDNGLVITTSGWGVSGVRCVVVRPGSADGKTPPKLVHDIPKPMPLVPTPLAKDGLLYLWCDNGIVSCIRLATGEIAWKERVEGSYYSSPIWIEGRLYCASRAGDMAIISASDKFELLARVPLGDKCHATPAVADNVMYLRTASQLMSLDGKKGR